MIMIPTIALVFASIFGQNPKLELAIDIPKTAKVSSMSWSSNPFRKTKTFRYGYFDWCDDPDCVFCADFVYKPNSKFPMTLGNPEIPIRK